MKILKNGNLKKNPFPVVINCTKCASEMEVYEEDVLYGYIGQAYFTCPVCGEKIYLNDSDIDVDMDVNEDNIVFPDHFYHFGSGKELSPDEIKRYIKDGIEWFRKNPDNFCYNAGSGDTLVTVFNYPGDKQYVINVSKGYYEAEIPFNNKDNDDVDRDIVWRNRGVDIKRWETNEKIT